MYPIDLLKVRYIPAITRMKAIKTDVQTTDAHASGEPDSRGDIHGHRQCHFHHFARRGLHVAMERIVQCGCRSW